MRYTGNSPRHLETAGLPDRTVAILSLYAILEPLAMETARPRIMTLLNTFQRPAGLSGFSHRTFLKVDSIIPLV